MASPGDYQYKIDEVGCPAPGAIAPKLRLTSIGGTPPGPNGVVTVTTYDDNTEIFQIINEPGALFATAGNTHTIANPDRVITRMKPAGGGSIETDCGGDSGVPIYIVKEGGEATLKIPVDVTGNWTPQVLRGHILAKKAPTNKQPTVKVRSIIARTPCNPLPSASVGSGIRTQTLYTFDLSGLFEILCTTDIAVTYVQCNPPQATGGNGNGYGATDIILLKEGPSFQVLPKDYHGIWVDPVPGPAPTLDSIVGFQISYARQDAGRNILYIAVNPTSESELQISIDKGQQIECSDYVYGNNLVENGNYRQYWVEVAPGYDSGPIVTISDSACAPWNGTVCTQQAQLSGSNFTATHGDGRGLAGALRLLYEIDVDDTFSGGGSATGGSVTVSWTGTVRVKKACQEGELTITLSGAFNGTASYSDCGTNSMCQIAPGAGSPSGYGSNTVSLGRMKTPWSDSQYEIKVTIYASFGCTSVGQPCIGGYAQASIATV